MRRDGVRSRGPGDGGEVAVGPFFGELAGFAEHDRHGGVGDLQLGQAVGHGGGPDPVEAEDLGVAVLDDDGGSGQGVQLAANRSRPPSRLATKSGRDLRSTTPTTWSSCRTA